jgi:very-short-patch-repair endonuclease
MVVPASIRTNEPPSTASPSPPSNRTLLDCAEILSRQRLRSLIEAAERLERVDLARLDAACARARGRRGLKRLRVALADVRGPAPWTQSELERRFLELTRDAGLPAPHANATIAGLSVDFCWPEQRLVVEVDGFAFHRTRRSFESDRRRDVRLQVAGWRVVRVTQAALERGRAALLADLRELLGAASAESASAASDR